MQSDVRDKFMAEKSLGNVIFMSLVNLQCSMAFCVVSDLVLQPGRSS